MESDTYIALCKQIAQRAPMVRQDFRHTRWLLIVAVCTAAAFTNADERALFERSLGVYKSECAVCHGELMEGAAQGTPLVRNDLVYGDSVEAIAKSIADGYPDKRMPAWSHVLSETEIKDLAYLISQTRINLKYFPTLPSSPLEIPQGVMTSEKHSFRMEAVIRDIDRLVFSIAPLPTGGMLLTEKHRGLSVISAAGDQSAYIEGAPRTYDKDEKGKMLDVALHPAYAKNGWVYLTAASSSLSWPGQHQFSVSSGK